MIVDDDDDRTEGFRPMPMVSSAVWGKRLRREKHSQEALDSLKQELGSHCLESCNSE